MLSVAPAALPLPANTPLGEGRYLLECEIGRGGFGVTYRARRVEDGELVAVKEVLLPGCTRDELSVCACDESVQKALGAWGERVLAQVERLSEIRHSHLARVWEAWPEHNTVYIAMELLEGPTLAHHIETNGPLRAEEALGVAGEVADALTELHERELVHLDVKPENVMLTARGAVLMDFDLVQPCGEVDVSTRPLSLAGRIGTPGYAPPESYGERAPQGAPSDVYSLGATLYFLLGALVPPSAVDRAAGVELPRLEVAPHLQEALDRALQLPIGARPASIRQFQGLWTPPAPMPALEDDYSFSRHAANFAQSQLTSGVYRVVLTTDNPDFPPRCVCCFEKADKDTFLPVHSPSGRHYIPGCQACFRHQEVARASGTGTAWGVGLSFPLVCLGVFLVVQRDAPFVMTFGFFLCVMALVVYLASLNYGALKNSRAEEMLKSSCCNLLEPVTYNFNGRVYIWRFKNVFYAEEFKKKNAPFVV